MLAGTPSIAFSTDDVPPAARLDHWRHVVAPLFLVTTPERGDDALGDVHGQLQAHRLECGVVARIAGGAQRLIRTPGLQAVTGFRGLLALVCVEGGGVLEAQGRTRAFAPGDVLLMDMARACVCDMGAFRHLALLLPRERLAGMMAGGNPHGLVMPARSVWSSAIGNHLSLLMDTAHALPDTEAEDLVDATTLLLERAARTLGEPHDDSKARLRSSLRLAVQDHIEAQLTNHALTPERLAASFRMSRATLYRLFEEEGGVAAYIQSRRLDRCYHLLARMGRAGRAGGIGEMAYAHGFGSEAHFSRAFRRRFGLSPREARAVAMAPAPRLTHDAAPHDGPAAHAASSLRAWLNTLGRGEKSAPGGFMDGERDEDEGGRGQGRPPRLTGPLLMGL